MRKVLIIAHRGASTLAPENTMLAFQRAIDLKADMIELDVHETVDGQIICIHDYSVDRTTNGSGIVSDLTYNEIRKLDAGEGEYIPLLEEVLDFCKGKIMVNIEVKAIGIESSLVSLVQKKCMMDQIIFSSFIHEALFEIKKSSSESRCALLYDTAIPDIVEYASSINANAINPHYELVSTNLVNTAHESKLAVYPWTINDTETALKVISSRVDGIITDFPDLIAAIISSNP